MDVIMGPWTAAHPENKPLAEAMGDEAWTTVQNSVGFTPKKSAPKGYGISGRVTSAVKQGNSTQVFAAFTIWVDGQVSNSPPTQGSASAEGSMTAEDAVRAIAEDKVKQILQVLKKGTVVQPR